MILKIHERFLSRRFYQTEQKAIEAFNKSDDMDAYISCTELKITATFILKSITDGGYSNHKQKSKKPSIKLFHAMKAKKKKEIAKTIQGSERIPLKLWHGEVVQKVDFFQDT